MTRVKKKNWSRKMRFNLEIIFLDMLVIIIEELAVFRARLDISFKTSYIWWCFENE